MWLNNIKFVEGTFFRKSSTGNSYEYRRKKQVAELKCDKSYGGKIAGEIRNKKYEGKIGKIIKPKGGYYEVYVRQTHSHRPEKNWVRQHIIVAENYIGRKLLENEVVHHIDGDKLNNNIENLDICSVSEHNNCHAKAEQIVFQLYKQGKVGYDKIKKLYYLI
jgi:hypothetical protein